jgi:hypothetical protein
LTSQVVTAVVDVLDGGLVSPRSESAYDVEDEVHGAPAAGPRGHVDGLMKDPGCGVDLVLAQVAHGEVGQHDGQGLAGSGVGAGLRDPVASSAALRCTTRRRVPGVGADGEFLTPARHNSPMRASPR